MHKRLIAVILILLLLVAPVLSCSAASYFNMGYWPGEKTYKLNAEECIQKENASVVGNGITFSGKGSVTYDFYFPFNSRSVTFKYADNKDAEITLDTGVEKYTIKLTEKSGEQKILFYDYLGHEPAELPYSLHNVGTVTVKEYTERKGDRIFKISSTKPVNITSVEFEKEITHISPSAGNPDLVLSDNEHAIETAVIIDQKASIILAKGARRYINLDDAQEIPFEMNGRLYLPIETLSRALGYYYENIPEKGYALLRQEPHEFSFINGEGFYVKGTSEKESIGRDLIIYREGKAYLTVRYFAEVLGKTVGYKDGIAVIDNSKHFVSGILESDEVFNYVKAKFVKFYPEKIKGNTYYVAQTSSANDENSGTIFAPFKTLEKAGKVAKAGDTVIIKEGTYREILMPQNDGTGTNPITFKAADGEKVVLSAAEVVDGEFVPYGDKGIYMTRVDKDLGDGRNQVYINGEAMVEARHPNGPGLAFKKDGTTELSKLWPVKGDMSIVDGEFKVKSDNVLNQEKDYWKGATYIGYFSYAWALATGKIVGSEAGQLNIFERNVNNMDFLYWWWWPQTVIESTHGNWGYISGHLNALDEPGEWYIKDNILFIMFPEGVTPENSVIEVKERQIVADLYDSKYIRLEGVSTLGGGMRLNESEMCVLNELDMHYISQFAFSADQQEGYIGAEKREVGENGAPQRGEVGVYVSGKDNVVVNSKFDHSAGAAIYMSGLYGYVENNIINDCGYMGSYVAGIYINAEPWKAKETSRGGYGIYNNTIYNCGRACFCLSSPATWSGAAFIPYEFAYNDLHNGSICTSDTGVIYDYAFSGGTDKHRASIHHNYIYNTTEVEERTVNVHGIYHDGNSMGVDTYNNIIFSTDEHVKYVNEIHLQIEPGANSNHDAWGNSFPSIVEESAKNLKNAHYPNGKPFYAGAWKDSDDYLVNYNNYKNGYTTNVLSAEETEKSEGVSVDESGYAVFSGDNQYICFKNVDLTNGTDHVLTMMYAGDKYLTGDKVSIIIGNLEDGKEYSYTLNVESQNFENNSSICVPFVWTEGKHDIYVRVDKFKSAKIAGIMIEDTKITDSAYSAQVFAGAFNSYVSSMTDSFQPSPFSDAPTSVAKPGLKNTWPVTTMEYSKILLTEPSDTVEIAACSAGAYNGQSMEIRVESPDGETIAKHTIDKASWTDYTPVDIKLSKKLDAGVYDFYVVFTNENGYNLSSNLWYFAFKKINTNSISE